MTRACAHFVSLEVSIEAKISCERRRGHGMAFRLTRAQTALA